MVLRHSRSFEFQADLLLDPISVSQSLSLGHHPDSAIDNVRRIFAAHEDREPPPVYSEMLQLRYEDKMRTWNQISRWIKYEQVVEGGGTRFSKPHITLLSVQGLLQARNCLRRGLVLLDSPKDSLSALLDDIIRHWEDRALVNPYNIKGVRKALWAPKVHMTINKSRRNSIDRGNEGEDDNDDETKPVEENPEETKVLYNNVSTNLFSESTGNVNTGELPQAEKRLLAKLIGKDPGTESCAILVGHVDTLEHPVSAFIRLREAQKFFPEIPDIPVPTKFIFILLTPRDNYEKEAISVGRTIGALMADEVFRKVAQFTQEPYTLGDAIEEFMSNIVVVPPGKCTTETRWEPREATVEENRSVGGIYSTRKTSYEEGGSHQEDGHGHAAGLVRTGKFFGGLFQDIRMKGPWFMSDFADYFRGRISQSLAATVFLFFANLTSIITFGAVMDKMLHHQMATIEAILCGGISGVIFALFSGQPLNILSATGPTLVFEKILFDFCHSNGWDFLEFRLLVGLWVAAMLITLTATDASALVGLITRFTEDAFATLISVVFIIQAFQKLMAIGDSEAAKSAEKMAALEQIRCKCFMEYSEDNASTINFLFNGTAEEQCQVGWIHELDTQHDVYMLSIVLTFGTFGLTYAFKEFRKSPFFSSNIRNAVSDFGVLIAIVVMTAYSHYAGGDIVPTLNIPDSFRPTQHRSWLVLPFDMPLHVIFIAILPAAFYTILIIMDQQITAVIVNRKDNLLKKGFGYHLDLFIIAILVIICSFLGLPFFVAATVLSVMHVDSLRVQSESAAPGEKAQLLGVKEQRLTAIIAHLAIGLSVFLTPVIKLVPMPVLIGVFLYMGVVSLLGQQFVQRVALWFMPVKHQPDYTWLRCVKMKRVHFFTLIQLFSILGLFAVKYTKTVSMGFPLMLIVMVLIRMFPLEKMFSQPELKALDDPVPKIQDVMRPKRRALNISGVEKGNSPSSPEQKLLQNER
ncbi:unnamed protein product, partial [Mesorhabditis belari]|uniref:Anion exchange protein n=1 Tax=Mesorhabditis belari TaxID=2138241 RepID=A0AAF3EQY2_9BILA